MPRVREPSTGGCKKCPKRRSRRCFTTTTSSHSKLVNSVSDNGCAYAICQ